MGVSPDAHFSSRFFCISTVIAAWPRTHNMFCLFWQLCSAGRLEALVRIIVAWICRNGSRGRLASCCRQETTSNLCGCSDAQHVHDLRHQNEKLGDNEQPQGRRDGIEGTAVWAVDVVLHKGESKCGRPDSDTCCCSWAHCHNFPIVAGKAPGGFLRRLF